MLIPQAVRSRLAQLLRLLLSATQDGEVIAAQRAINRTLDAADIDLHTFAGVIDGTYVRHPLDDDGRPNWRDKVAYCSMMSSALSDRERIFINDMLGWRGEPTPKQSSWLDAIHARLKLRTAA